MNIYHDKIAVFLCLANRIQQAVRIQTAEYAGRIIGGSLCVGIIQPLDLCGGNNRYFYIPGNEINRFRRLFQIPPGTNIRHSDAGKGIQCIQKGIFSIIVSMIIGKGYDIHSHFLQNRGRFRPSPESKLLSFRRNSPGRIRKLIIDHHNVRVFHLIH